MKVISLLAAALAAASVCAAPGKLAPSAPLVSDGPLVVDSTDFEASVLRIPENKREEVRMSYDRVATLVDGIYITRSLAARARALGLDQDPTVQKRLQLAQDDLLAELYVQRIESQVVPVNLEQRARELYKAEQSKFVTGEEVYIQHILVDLNGRTRDTALERARKAVAEAKAGEDFLSVATRYSDADARRHGGDLGYSSPTSFVEPVRAAIATLKAKGEIAGPVESESGFHVIKFIDRKPSQPIKYEAVARKLIASEEARLKKQRIGALVQEIRSSASVVVHRENVEKLVVKVDPEVVRRALEEKPPAK